MLIGLSFNVSCRPFKTEVLVPGRLKRVSPPSVTRNRHALFIVFIKLLHKPGFHYRFSENFCDIF